MRVSLKRDDSVTTFIPSKMFDFMHGVKPISLSVDGEACQILEAAGGDREYVLQHYQRVPQAMRLKKIVANTA